MRTDFALVYTKPKQVREFMRSFILPAVCERVLLVRGGFTAGLVGFSPDEMIHRQQANQVRQSHFTYIVNCPF